LRQTSATAEPSSACFKTKTICACENFDAFMELSSSSSRDHNWKIPAQIGLIWWEQVTGITEALNTVTAFEPG
jgi:hypothetical protein